ncbi:MAG: hypothetical protein AAF945_05960, partial [Actinomycetota bacterium]
FSWSDDRTGDRTSDVDDRDDADDRWDGDEECDDEWGDDEWDSAEDEWRDGTWDSAEDEWRDGTWDSAEDEWGDGHDGDDADDDEWDDDDVVWLDEDDDVEAVVSGRSGPLRAALPTRTGIITGVGALLVTTLLVLGPVGPWSGGTDAVDDDPTPSSVRSGPERRGGRVDTTVSAADATPVAAQ